MIMFLRLVSEPTLFRSTPIQASYMKLSVVDTCKDGVICHTSEFKPFCVSDMYDGMFISDFSIQNVLATGAVNMLQPCQMSNPDVSGNVVKMSDFVDKLSNNEKAS